MILQVETRRLDPDMTVVELIGRMSLGNQLLHAEDQIKKLITEGSKKLIIDLKSLSYVDSAAIGVLVMLFGTVTKAGGQMRLAGPNAVVGKIFDITQLRRIIPIDSDVATASTSFK